MEHTWTTTFNTSRQQMLHVFSEIVTVINDFKTREITVYKDGKQIRKVCNDMSVSAYTLFLISISEDVQKLKTFG